MTHRLPVARTAFVIAVFGSAVGFAITLAPAATVVALAAALGLFALLQVPRPFVVALLAFLLVQEPLLILAGEQTPAGRVFKYADELLVLLVGVGSLLFVRGTWAALKHRGLLLAVAGCYMGMIASSVAVRTPLMPAALDLLLFSKPFLLFAIGLTIAVRTETVERSVRTMAAFMLAVVAAGALFVFAPDLQQAYVGGLRPVDERLGFVSAQGIFLGPGVFSWFAVGTFCVCYAAYLAYRRVGYLLASCLAAALAVLSWRRKSILGLVAVLVVAVVTRSESRTRMRAIAVAACGLLLAATVLLPYMTSLWFHTLEEYGGAALDSTARAALYRGSLEIAWDHFPLGTGLASFGSHASKLFYSDVYHQYGLSRVWGLSPQQPDFITDTFWPMVLGQGGVIAFLSYTAFFALLIQRAWRHRNRTRGSPTDDLVSLGALFLLVASLFESVASHVYGSSLHGALVMFPAGILWRRTAQVDAPGEPPHA